MTGRNTSNLADARDWACQALPLSDPLTFGPTSLRVSMRGGQRITAPEVEPQPANITEVHSAMPCCSSLRGGVMTVAAFRSRWSVTIAALNSWARTFSETLVSHSHAQAGDGDDVRF
jgi:hypothetical protein